jgi:23S rRNA pseudouridine1911/1915/1917 synthase
VPLRTLTADRGDAGRRLDLVLRRHLTDLTAATRTRVQAWIEHGLVTVNGTAVRRVSSRAAFGDLVSIALPHDAAAAPRRVMAAEDVPLHVLFEDEHLLALDKPAGVVMHPTYKHTDGTLMNALLWYARAWPAGQRPSLVGRLDKLTSGLVLVAKTAAAHAALQKTLSHPRSEKDYLAVVYGRVNVARGEIAVRLGTDRSDRRRVVASPDHGAESITRFERLKRVAAPRAGLALVRCRLVTGRMHQIRVHLTTRGWPIVGDPTYGQPRWSVVDDAALAARLRTFPRQALHAWRIAFTHPIGGERIVVHAPPPPDLSDLLTATGLQTDVLRLPS